ncbi:BnaA02g16990D [Brassica napus]|uniref:BnaA02g16990D protein n=1 Tax=Brassica napus TaxID=3708 RepID=A0A078I7G8_BRANA|nr:BnaA02g16990D [Brassica napus]
MCEGCLLSFATQKESDCDTYKKLLKTKSEKFSKNNTSFFAPAPASSPRVSHNKVSEKESEFKDLDVDRTSSFVRWSPRWSVRALRKSPLDKTDMADSNGESILHQLKNEREIWMMTPQEKSFLKKTVFLGQTAIAKRPNQSLILQFVLQIMPKHRSKWSCNTEESSVLVQMKSLEDWTSERGMNVSEEEAILVQISQNLHMLRCFVAMPSES